MAGLLVSIGVMSVLLSVLLPAWTLVAKREREAELIFRGEQYARAIELYQRQYVGAYPPDFDTLVEERFLRRLYKDPMTEDGVFPLRFSVSGRRCRRGFRQRRRPARDEGRRTIRSFFRAFETR